MKCSVEEKRKILDSFKGKIFSVEFVKKDKSIRKATCKHFVHKAFTEGHASKAHASTVEHKIEYFTAVELKNSLTENTGWININMATLKSIRCGSVDITFED